MRMTLPHHTTMKQAIKRIDDKLNEAIKMKFPAGITVVDPQKDWSDNIMHFSFTVQRLFLSLDFSGIVIVYDQEVVGECELPGIVTTFFSEDTIKAVVKKEFNKLFNIG